MYRITNHLNNKIGMEVKNTTHETMISSFVIHVQIILHSNTGPCVADKD